MCEESNNGRIERTFQSSSFDQVLVKKLFESDRWESPIYHKSFPSQAKRKLIHDEAVTSTHKIRKLCMHSRQDNAGEQSQESNAYGVHIPCLNLGFRTPPSLSESPNFSEAANQCHESEMDCVSYFAHNHQSFAKTRLKGSEGADPCENQYGTFDISANNSDKTEQCISSNNILKADEVTNNAIEGLAYRTRSVCSPPKGRILRQPSMRLRAQSVALATVLCIDIKGFTAGCAAMDAHQVGEWVLNFYSRVDAAAAEHGVSKVEMRGDCCICVAGVEGVVRCPILAPAATDPVHNQATRMLAFAAALHNDLSTLTYKSVVPGDNTSTGRVNVTSTRMGMATGEVAFLVANHSAGGISFTSVQGDTVNKATQMESLAAPGAPLVHTTTADRWLLEGARRAAPAMVGMEVKGHGLQWAAVFDCAASTFRPAARAATLPNASMAVMAKAALSLTPPRTRPPEVAALACGGRFPRSASAP